MAKSKCDMGLEVRSQFDHQDYQVIAKYLGATMLLNNVWVHYTQMSSGLVANHGLFQKHLVSLRMAVPASLKMLR